MLPRYDLGGTVYKISERITQLEVGKDITNAQSIFINKNLRLEYAQPDTIAYIDYNKDVISKNLSDLIFSKNNQTQVIANVDNTITVGTVQDIGLTSIPQFGGLTITGNIGVSGTVDGVDISSLGNNFTSHVLNNTTAHFGQDLTSLGTPTFNKITLTQIPTATTDVITKGYLDTKNQYGDWQSKVNEMYDPTNGIPVSPIVGDRYICVISANSWVANNIYEWNALYWIETIPKEGFVIWVNGGTINSQRVMIYSSGAWIPLDNKIHHQSLNGAGTNSHTDIDNHITNNTTAHFGQDLSITGEPTFSYVNVSNKPTALFHAANKSYVDSVVQGINWQRAVKSYYDPTIELPVLPTIGDRYISSVNANGWIINRIYEWDSETWTETIPTNGFAVFVVGGSIFPESSIVYNGFQWVQFGSTLDHTTLQNIGINTHAQIDSHMDNSTNAHFGQDLKTSSTPNFNALSLTQNITSTSTSTGTLIIAGGIGVGGELTAQTAQIIALTQSTDILTGALVLRGGIGIAGNLNIDGRTRIYLTTDTSSSTSGALVIDGGVSIKKSLFVNQSITTQVAQVTSTIESSNNSTGALIVSGGVGIAKNLNVGGDTILNGKVIISNTIDASNITTGNLVISGGVGIAKKLYVGGNTNITGDLQINGTFYSPNNSLGTLLITSTENSTSINSGSLIINGGVGINNDVNVGGSINTQSITTPIINITSTNNSTSTASGALVILGGVGIAKDVFIGGKTIITNDMQCDVGIISNTTDIVGTQLGSLRVSGGASIAKSIAVAGNATIIGMSYLNDTIIQTTTDATNTVTGSLIVNGGVGIKSSLYVGDRIIANGSGTMSSLNLSAIILSTDTRTGTLVVNGGVGIAKQLNIGGAIRVNGMNNATDTLTGALIVSGGTSIGKNCYIGLDMYICGTSYLKNSVINSTNNSTCTSSGSLIVNGGIGIAKDVYIGGKTVISGELTVNTGKIINTIDASNTLTGAIIISGGTAIAKQLYVGGNTTLQGNLSVNKEIIQSTDDATNTITGALIINGGVTIAKQLRIGTSITSQTANITTVLISGTTSATDLTTGALVVSGGIGVGGTIVTGQLNMTNSVNMIDIDSTLSANSDVRLSTQRANKTYVDTSINNLCTLIANPTGFPNITDSVLTFTDSLRQFTIAPDWVSFDYYINNIKYTKTIDESIIISNVGGMHYIYYDGATLKETLSFTDDLIINKVYIATVYWNEIYAKSVCFNEARHGVSMSPYTQRVLYYGQGAIRIDGLSPSNFTLGNGSLNAHAQFMLGEGNILIQDIKKHVNTKGVTNSIKILYIDNNRWNYTLTTGAYYTDNTKLYYNKNTLGVWSLQPIEASKYVLGHIIATNYVGDINFIAILGQQQYNDIATARTGATTELSSMYLANLPLGDWIFVATVIYVCGPSFTNNIKGAIVEVSTGVYFIDWRSTKLNSTAGSITEHSSLSGLSNDDHLQYVSVEGRSTDIINITNTLDSSDSTTGSLIIAGGVGISRDLYVGNQIATTSCVITNTKNSTDSTTGSLIVVGGVGIANNLNVGGHLGVNGNLYVNGIFSFESATVNGTIDSSDSTTGSLVVSGGVGIAKNLNVGENLTVNGIFSFETAIMNGTIDSSDSTTGSLILNGGIGIAKNLNVGANVGINGLLTGVTAIFTDTSDSFSFTTGALTIAGGIGISKNVYIGGTTSSTDTITGALIVNGGVGIAENLNVSGSIHATQTLNVDGNTTLGGNTELWGHVLCDQGIDSTSKTSGSVVVNGGIGIKYGINASSINTTKNFINIPDSGQITQITMPTDGSLTINVYDTVPNAVLVIPLHADTYVYYSSRELPYPEGSGSGNIINSKYVLNGSNSITWSNVESLNIANIATFKFKYTPLYSGIPIQKNGMLNIGTIVYPYTANLIRLYHNTTGELNLTVNDSSSIVIYADAGIYSWTNAVSGTEYEIELNINIIGGEFNAYLFIDGVLRGSPNVSGIESQTVADFIQLGGDITGGFSTTNAAFRDLVIYNTVQHTTNYTFGYILEGGINMTPYGYIKTDTLIVRYPDDSTKTFTTTVNSTGCATLNSSGNLTQFDVSNQVKVLNTIDAITITTGALVVSGGVGIAKQLQLGGNLTMGTNSISTVGAITSSGTIKTINTEISTSTTTGALQVSGGASIGQLIITQTTLSTNTTTGSLVVSGGVGIAKNLFVGGDVVAPQSVNNLKYYGAVGNNTTDDKVAVENCVAGAGFNKIQGRRKALGQYYCSSLNAPLADFDDNLQIAVGASRRLYNSYAYKEMVFNSETLFGLTKKMYGGKNVVITFSGDSITEGVGFDNSYSIDQVFLRLCNFNGINNVSVLNRGHAAKKATDWDTTYVADDIAENPDVFVLRWGTNDALLGTGTMIEMLNSCIAGMSSGLNKIRTAFPISSGVGIVLMTPTSGKYSAIGALNEYYLEELQKAYRRLAIDYKCCFIDTYGLWQNALDGGGLWFIDSYIHPNNNQSVRIGSVLFDTCCPSHMVKSLGNHLNKQDFTIEVPSNAVFYISGRQQDAEFSLSAPQHMMNPYDGENVKKVLTINANRLELENGEYVCYMAGDNIDGGNTGCFRFNLTTSYSGNPTSITRFVWISNRSSDKFGNTGNNNNDIDFVHNTNGTLGFAIKNTVGGVIASQFLPIWAPVAGTVYEFEFNWNLTAGATRLFIDGTQHGSTNTGTGVRVSAQHILIGGVTNMLCYLDHISVYKTPQHTTNYVKRAVNQSILAESGLTTLNGVFSGLVNVSSTTEATTTTTGSLVVSGGVGIAKSLYVGINATITGLLTTGSASIIITSESSDSTTGSLIVYGGVGISKNLNIGGNLDVNGTFSFESATMNGTLESSDSTTGSLIVYGGVGISKNLNVGANVGIIGTLTGTSGMFTTTTDASDTATGALTISGGIGIAKQLWVGGNTSLSTLSVITTTQTTSKTTGALIVSGGVGIAKDLYIGGSLLKIQNTAGVNEERVLALGSPISIATAETATIYSLTIVNPIRLAIYAFGYDQATLTHSFICDTSYYFVKEGTNIVSLNGDNGSPENLYWSHTSSGWNFTSGVFSFVDNGNGAVDITFTHNGQKTDILNITTVKVSSVISVGN